jgi:hypothetical protein
MGQRGSSQRHTGFPMLRQRWLKQFRYGRGKSRSRPKVSDDLDRMRCGDEPAVDRWQTSVRHQRADVPNVNRCSARDLVGREDVEPGGHFFHERWGSEGQNSCRMSAPLRSRLAACFRHFLFDRRILSPASVLLHRQRTGMVRTLGRGWLMTADCRMCEWLRL